MKTVFVNDYFNRFHKTSHSALVIINFIFIYFLHGNTKKTVADVLSTTVFYLLGDVLLSQDPAVQVPSALEGLTVV
uniref:hypothetical protein n=1 Tax=Paenibacillus gallinarum TaxID=2762232 RepID=UPI001CD8EA5B